MIYLQSIYLMVQKKGNNYKGGSNDVGYKRNLFFSYKGKGNHKNANIMIPTCKLGELFFLY